MMQLIGKLKKSVQLTIRDVKNSASRRRFKPTPLNENQQSVLEELQENGFVKIPVNAFLMPTEWEKYRNDFSAFLEDPKTKELRSEYYAAGKTEGHHSEKQANKTYIITGKRVFSDFLQRTGLANFNKNAFLRPIIDNYFGLECKLVYADYWYTLKTHNPNQDVYSQAWHCDPEADKIVKIFIYFNDVDEQNGALQYIKGTQEGGKNASLLSPIRKRHKNLYPGDDFINQSFAKQDIVAATAPKGTMILCDTRGLHRGGKCLNDERQMLVFQYLDKGIFTSEVS